jgi:hypothetical protein
MTIKPITDKAEVSIDFPDKFYVGAFTRHAGFEAKADAEGVALKLVRSGDDKRVAEFHLHYYLFADILDEIAESMAAQPPIDEAHREPLIDAVAHLRKALKRRRRAKKKPVKEFFRPSGRS